MKKNHQKIPKGKTYSARKDKKDKSKQRGKSSRIVRGKEVTVREAGASGQIVYGRFKIGGNVTFADLSADSKAQLSTDDGRRQITWKAKTGGAPGNLITVKIVISAGTNPTLTVGVVGNDITVNAKTVSGVSDSTANQVINKVRTTPAADALVAVHNVHVEGDDASDDGTGKVQAFTQTNLSGGGGTWFHRIITLAAHEIDAIEGVYLDGNLVTFGGTPDARWATGLYANRVFMATAYGSDSQEGYPDLDNQLPTKWNSTYRQRGCAGVYMILIWNANTFPEGDPEITFLIRGKKVYDPRTGTTVWSRNAALITADYLVNDKWGAKVAYADIDEPTLIAAANICDGAVGLLAGGTEARYSIDGVFDSSDSIDSVLTEMSAAMGGGDITYQGGKWYIYPAAWRAPTMTLTLEDLRGDFSITTHISRSDNFNSIRGTHPAIQADYNETDIPVVKNALYISEDGGVQLFEDVVLNFVTSSSQAQRILKIFLEQVRQGTTINWPATLKGLLLQNGDTVNLDLTRLGYAPKIFEVRECEIVLDDGYVLGTDLVLKETAEGIYNDSGEETTVDLSPNTSLPSASDVEPPTDLILTSGTTELYVRGDGTVAPRLKVSWTPSTSIFVLSGGHYEIQFKRSADATYSQSFNVPGGQTFHHLTDVEQGVAYDVRIKSVNTLAFDSDWVTELNHIVIGKLEKPSDVNNFTLEYTDQGLALSWDEIPDLDVFGYEIRWGSGSWDTSTFVVQLQGHGTAYLYQYFSTFDIQIRIKAIDTSGNYSTNDTSVITDIEGPNPARNFVITTINNNVLLDWDSPLPSTFSVNEYMVYKGPVFATAEFVGQVFGTFHALLEQVAGPFTYWVVAVDVGGNISTAVSSDITVSIPNNFYVVDHIELEDTLPDSVEFDHCLITALEPAELVEQGSIYLPTTVRVIGAPMMGGPIYAWESYENWMDNNGWLTLQDAIDAGHVEWLQPGPTTNLEPVQGSPGLNQMIQVPVPVPGFFQLQYDLGSVLPPSVIAWTWNETDLGSTEDLDSPVSKTPSVQTSVDGVTWTEFANASQVFSDSFRYVRFRMDFVGTTLYSLIRLDNLHLQVYLERDEETGIAACLAADSGGTEVFFTKDWFDVEDIQLTVEGTAPAYPVLNFTDVQNPTSFRILVFDHNGSRIDKSVRYRVRGALNQ